MRDGSRRCGTAVEAVDEAIVHLDSPSEPWTVHLELRFAGALEESRLRRALKDALDRHPRARARMVEALPPGRGSVWQSATTADVDPLDVVRCDGDDALVAAREDLLSRPLSLEAPSPLRLRLLQHPAGDVVLLSVHHAVGDGMAALVLLQSVARAYRGRPEVVAAPAPCPALLPFTGDSLRVVAAELREGFRPSARIARDGEREAPGYGVHLLRLDAARTRALRNRARDGTTVNDLLLAALHLTVAKWNSGHGKRCGRVSVLMPVNLRPRPRWREGFENRTFMVPVATRRRDRVSAAAAVDAVARRTRWIKKQQSAAAVAGCLQSLHWMPLTVRRGLVRQAARKPLVPTTLLSNLGPVEHDLDFGPGLGPPTQVWFSPPAKMPLGLAIGALTADEKLHLAFRARHPLLGPQALESFAASFDSVLDALLGRDDVRAQPSAVRGRAA